MNNANQVFLYFLNAKKILDELYDKIVFAENHHEVEEISPIYDIGDYRIALNELYRDLEKCIMGKVRKDICVNNLLEDLKKR